jgi:glycosyltransferase involved in cell wall biosynthesis
MRLVILTPSDLDTGAGGIERFTRTLVPPLERRGWSTRVIWPRPGDVRVPMPVEKAGAGAVVAALRTWRRHREEIADADAVLANGVMGWCVSHPRLVVVFHANLGGYAKAIRPSVSFAEYARNRYVHGGFMAVGGIRGTAVEVSRQNASEMGRYYGVRRVAVIENGITPGSFAGGDAEAARRRHGLPAGRIALFPGRVEYRKGADVLRALPPLLPAGTTLVVAGPRALGAPDVIDLGPQGAGELRDLYAAADVAVLPTRFEGSSFSVIEAQDAGLPLVTCRQGHVAEMLEREPALRPTVVPSLEPGPFADRIRLLLEDRDLARQVAEAGRRYVHEHHDAERMAAKYDDLLRGRGFWRPATNGRLG